MTRRTSIVQLVGNYFASKGKVLTADEYKAQDDVPVRFQVVKRTIGSWSRLVNMIGDIKQYDGTVKEEPVYTLEQGEDKTPPAEEAVVVQTPVEVATKAPEAKSTATKG